MSYQEDPQQESQGSHAPGLPYYANMRQTVLDIMKHPGESLQSALACANGTLESMLQYHKADVEEKKKQLDLSHSAVRNYALALQKELKYCAKAQSKQDAIQRLLNPDQHASTAKGSQSHPCVSLPITKPTKGKELKPTRKTEKVHGSTTSTSAAGSSKAPKSVAGQSVAGLPRPAGNNGQVHTKKVPQVVAGPSTSAAGSSKASNSVAGPSTSAAAAGNNGQVLIKQEKEDVVDLT